MHSLGLRGNPQQYNHTPLLPLWAVPSQPPPAGCPLCPLTHTPGSYSGPLRSLTSASIPSYRPRSHLGPPSGPSRSPESRPGPLRPLTAPWEPPEAHSIPSWHPRSRLRSPPSPHKALGAPPGPSRRPGTARGSLHPRGSCSEPPPTPHSNSLPPRPPARSLLARHHPRSLAPAPCDGGATAVRLRCSRPGYIGGSASAE